MEAKQYQELIQLLQRLLEDQITAREKATQDMIATQVEVQVLREKLKYQQDTIAMRDALLAAKDETIGLLRASYRNPN